MSEQRIIVTTSWDDGHPADLKLAELLSKYRISGTFYVPCRNREARDVIDARGLRAIAKEFEIGAHTLDHVDLTTVSGAEAERQIETGKARLEDTLGSSVSGFCYPRGGHSRSIRNLTRKAGFSYARTIRNFCLDAGDDRFALPTSIQFYPHSRSVYFRNFVRGGAYATRSVSYLTAATAGGIDDRVKRLVDLCAARGMCFHLWGHSWEIVENGLWKGLEAALSHMSSLTHESATNLEVVQKLVP